MVNSFILLSEDHSLQVKKSLGEEESTKQNPCDSNIAASPAIGVQSAKLYSGFSSNFRLKIFL